MIEHLDFFLFSIIVNDATNIFINITFLHFKFLCGLSSYNLFPDVDKREWTFLCFSNHITKLFPKGL